MLNERLAAAHMIIKPLAAAERGGSDTVKSLAQLQIALHEARTKANMALGFGHEVDVAVAKAAQAAVEMCAAIVEAHDKLADVQKRAGLGAYAMGGGAYKGQSEAPMSLPSAANG